MILFHFLDNCNFTNETTLATSIKLFTQSQRSKIKECDNGFIVDTNIAFEIKRIKSRHKSKLMYWREDMKQIETFDFSMPSSSAFAPSSDIHFDGRNLTCKKIDGVHEECNGLPLDEPIPIILFSLEIGPRDAEFYEDVDANKWNRNKYSLDGSYYRVKCKGKTITTMLCFW